MLQRMVEGAKISGTLADLRLTTACLLSFAGFLRFSELVISLSMKNTFYFIFHMVRETS